MSLKKMPTTRPVICVMPDGSEFEITLVSLHGEEVSFDNRASEAIQFLKENFSHLFHERKPRPPV